MTDHYFTCPECGGHYFGRDIGPDHEPLPTVACHGDGSDQPYRKCWWGVWPVEKENQEEA